MSNPHSVTVLVLWPYRFKEFDWLRFELDYFLLESNVQVHDLSNFLFPKLVINKNSLEDYLSRDLFVFCTFFEWFNSYSRLIKSLDRTQLVILNFVPKSTLLSLLINFIIRLSDFIIIEFDNPGLPVSMGINLNNFRQKIISHLNIFLFFKVYSFIRCKIIMFLSTVLFSNLIVNNVHTMIVGLQNNHKFKNTSTFYGCSWDYSSILRLSSNKYPLLIQDRYVVFLDGAGPNFSSDAVLDPIKFKFTSHNWYPSLNKFFSFIENTYNCRVVIAASPHAKYTTQDLFCGRDTYSGLTLPLVRDSLFVITRISTAISYALHFSKPIIFLTSNELKNIPPFFAASMNISSKLDKIPLNIDNYNTKDVDYSLDVNTSLYNKYIATYLSCLPNPCPNYRTILDLFFSKLR